MSPEREPNGVSDRKLVEAIHGMENMLFAARTILARGPRTDMERTFLVTTFICVAECSQSVLKDVREIYGITT